VVRVTVNGHGLDFRDRQLMLTTGGRDLGSCPGQPSESQDWRQITP
jgi:hypothetical protein